MNLKSVGKDGQLAISDENLKTLFETIDILEDVYVRSNIVLLFLFMYFLSFILFFFFFFTFSLLNILLLFYFLLLFEEFLLC